MSKQTLDAPLTLSTDNGSASPFTTLDDFFSATARPQETAVIAGKTCHFEGMSAAAKDHLIGYHSRDDGEGNVSVENKQWRTNVIAESWVKAFGGARVLAKKEDATASTRPSPRRSSRRCTKSPRASRGWATRRSAEKTPAPMVVRQLRVRLRKGTPSAPAPGDGGSRRHDVRAGRRIGSR
jgi:hypothetical protein